MKKLSGFIFSLLLFSFFNSCTFVDGSNSITIQLPGSSSSRNAQADPIDETIFRGFTFIVSLSSSNSYEVEKLALPGDYIEFSSVPLGTAVITITAYDKTWRPGYIATQSVYIENGPNVATIRLNTTGGRRTTKGISELVTYLNTEAEDNEIITVINDNSSITINQLSGVTCSAANITLDYSNFSGNPTISQNAFTSTNTWLGYLILPNSLTNIQGFSKVNTAVFLSVPSPTVSSALYSVADSTSKYSLYFMGSLDEFCGRVKTPTTVPYTNYPFHNGVPFYVLRGDKRGYEEITGGTLKLTGYYIDSNDGILKTVKTIPKYLFRKIQCNKIEIADVFEEIGEAAFAWAETSEVVLGHGLKKINNGSLYYNNNSVKRTVKYNGSINDWMKIGCGSDDDPVGGEGGPFINGLNEFLVKDSSGQYVSPVSSNGILEITISDCQATIGNGTTKFDDINGQLQGLKGFTTLVVFTENSGELYTVTDYAFMGCSDLSSLQINGKVSFGDYVFKTTNLNEIVLNCDSVCVCTSNTFKNIKTDSTDAVTIKIPAAMLTSYRAHTVWAALETAGTIEFQTY